MFQQWIGRWRIGPGTRAAAPPGADPEATQGSGGTQKRRGGGGMREGSTTTRFREVMGRFATGVAIVTGETRAGDPFGFTANAVASVSLDPLLVLVGVDRDSASLPALRASGRFALSFLAEDDRELALRFARAEREARFEGLDLRREATGAPVLERALGWLDCSLWKEVEAGDHHVLFGEVEGCGAGGEAAPLVFYDGRYRSLAP